ncbi:hypothetical protein DF185_08865 [Marinifilum breve]|uniref:Uncharacterized protein n=1 Tax=Marinifilum breve TaxID=2184082 RepID=A0A2V4A2M0_9BACT|nr:hypothetical protein DF185_08865 [Marinifilum breve]
MFLFSFWGQKHWQIALCEFKRQNFAGKTSSTEKNIKILLTKCSRWLELTKSIGKNALDEQDTQFFTDNMLSTSNK